MKQQLTNDPTILADLDGGTRYTVQNKSKNTMYIQHFDSVPVGVSDAFVMKPFGFGVVRKLSGHEVYVWSNFSVSASIGTVVYDEVA